MYSYNLKYCILPIFQLLTKDADVHKLYMAILNSIIFQNNVLKCSKLGWSMKNMIYIEIHKSEKKFGNKVIRLTSLNHGIGNININNETGII